MITIDYMEHVQTSSLKGVYTLFKPEGQSQPILFDSPHSGRHKPTDFYYTCAEQDLDSLSDLYVDDLFADTPQLGCVFLRAETSRAYIDLNRPTEDIDLYLLSDIWPHPITSKGRSKHGVGLVFRKGKNGIPIYQEKLIAADIEQRIVDYYTPYHGILGKELKGLHEKHGGVLHLNCHSFPSKQGLRAMPDFVLGDRHGTTCAPHILKQIRHIIETYGYSVEVNYPYQGQEIIKRTGTPRQGYHSIQIEINRALYMNEQKLIKTNKFKRIKENINFISKDISSIFSTPDLAAD